LFSAVSGAGLGENAAPDWEPRRGTTHFVVGGRDLETQRHKSNSFPAAFDPKLPNAHSFFKSAARVERRSAREHIRRMDMLVNEAMSTDVAIVSADQSIGEAARFMADFDIGVLPVEANDRLVGMITDRDIAVRAVAGGQSPDIPVADVMTTDVKYCFEDDTVDEVAKNMADLKVRRLPVLDRNKRLVGILTLGDIAIADGPHNAGGALCVISRPGGAHSQSSTEAEGPGQAIL
jgi:CBS domain-containing protein